MIATSEGYSAYQKKNVIVIGVPEFIDVMDRKKTKLTDAELYTLLSQVKYFLTHDDKEKA